jgi:hypothetical protein
MPPSARASKNARNARQCRSMPGSYRPSVLEPGFLPDARGADHSAGEGAWHGKVLAWRTTRSSLSGVAHVQSPSRATRIARQNCPVMSFAALPLKLSTSRWRAGPHARRPALAPSLTVSLRAEPERTGGRILAQTWLSKLGASSRRKGAQTQAASGASQGPIVQVPMRCRPKSGHADSKRIRPTGIPQTRALNR